MCVCVCVHVGTQHAIRTRNFVICELLGSEIFFLTISYTARFSKKKKLLNKICVFRFSVQLLSETFFINSLNAELNPICHLLALLGAHHILHVSKIGLRKKLAKYDETYILVFM